MSYLAVFDWNGTLIDDLEANLKGANAVLNMLGRSPLSVEQYQDTFTFPILHFYRANGVSADEYLAKHDILSRVFLDTYEKEVFSCELRPKTTELLEWLNVNGIDCIILSNHLRENVEQQLARFHIRHYFTAVSCNEIYDAAFIQRMNKAERLDNYMSDSGYVPSDCAIIGDSHEEPEIARHLGLTSVSILGGFLSENRIRKIDTDYIVADIEEMFEPLSQVWNIKYRKVS
jgi:phosphoglycolate phosphatase